MKRLLSIICLALMLFGFLSGLIMPRGLNAAATTAEQETLYGLIKEGAVLKDQQKNPVTSLPDSYFIIIKNEDAGYYEVTYLTLTGFIEKDFIEAVDYEPKTKFHTAYYTAKNDTFPTNIRLSPSSDSSVAATIPLNQKAYMYGSLEGQALIGAAGATWYYVEYDGVSGYAYCAHGAADTIMPNVIEKIEKPIDLTPPEDTQFKLDKWIYILAATVPSVIIMLALFSRPKKEAADKTL